MEIMLQTDGQLYPPKAMPPKPKPAPKEEHKPEPPPPPAAKPIPWEEFLLAAIAFIVLKSDDKPDIPLLLALAYILFDSSFSLKGLL